MAAPIGDGRENGEAMHSRLKSVEQCHAGEACTISFADLTLLLDPAGVAVFEQEKVLVVSDLHLEKGSSFARRGVYLPPYDTAATLARRGGGRSASRRRGHTPCARCPSRPA